MYGKAVFYLFASGAVGLALLAVAKPSQSEIEDIKKYQSPQFAAAIKTAALMKEPIYRQSPAQIQQKIQQSLKEIQAEQAAAKGK